MARKDIALLLVLAALVLLTAYTLRHSFAIECRETTHITEVNTN